jgi:hypothetical protein
MDLQKSNSFSKYDVFEDTVQDREHKVKQWKKTHR